MNGKNAAGHRVDLLNDASQEGTNENEGYVKRRRRQEDESSGSVRPPSDQRQSPGYDRTGSFSPYTDASVRSSWSAASAAEGSPGGIPPPGPTTSYQHSVLSTRAGDEREIPYPDSHYRQVLPYIPANAQTAGSPPYAQFNTEGMATSSQFGSAHLQPRSSHSSASSTRPNEKRFPCQFAKELRCKEYFTTSGHASRHSKKHTGEKNVKCPQCSKTFARKDNMKQHLKTHENRGQRSTSTSAGQSSRGPSLTERTSMGQSSKDKVGKNEPP